MLERLCNNPLQTATIVATISVLVAATTKLAGELAAAESRRVRDSRAAPLIGRFVGSP